MNSSFLPTLLVVARIRLSDSSCRAPSLVLTLMGWQCALHWSVCEEYKSLIYVCWQWRKCEMGAPGYICAGKLTRARAWAGSTNMWSSKLWAGFLVRFWSKPTGTVPKWCLVMVWVAANVCPITPDTLQPASACVRVFFYLILFLFFTLVGERPRRNVLWGAARDFGFV